MHKLDLKIDSFILINNYLVYIDSKIEFKIMINKITLLETVETLFKMRSLKKDMKIKYYTIIWLSPFFIVYLDVEYL